MPGLEVCSFCHGERCREARQKIAVKVFHSRSIYFSRITVLSAPTSCLEYLNQKLRYDLLLVGTRKSMDLHN
jgi:hypothetical protein